MMSGPKPLLIDSVDSARAGGRAVTIDPPATRDQMRNLQSRCSAALPPDILELVAYAAGISVDRIAVDFCGDHPFEFEAMFKRSVPIATDGEGNFWVVDVSSSGAWRTVFLVAHDPPVAVLQARDLKTFIEQVFDASGPEALKGDAIAQVWKENPYAISRAQALASSDPAVRQLAEQINDDYAIVDLRPGKQGSGFVWGTAGPNTDVRRAGEELLFAIERKKRGLFARFFSS